MGAQPVQHTPRQSMDIAESLIRVSLGIEATQDLLADFEQAFVKLGQRP